MCVGHDLVERSLVEFSFSMGRDTATALTLYVFVSPAAVRLGHGPYPRHSLAVLLSTDPAQNPASVCPAALEVPSFVVCICAVSMISWNALRNTQPCNYHETTFLCWLCAVVHPYVSTTSSTKPALRRRVPRVCSVRYVSRHTAGIYRRYYRYRTLR